LRKDKKNYYIIREGKKGIRKCYYVKRLRPIIPKSREFKRNLRNELLRSWDYASHYVDSAIKVAYSIINAWRRNYIKGRRGRSEPPPTGVGVSSVRLVLYISSHICRFRGSRLPHPMRLINAWAIDASSLRAYAPLSATCHIQNLSVTHLSLYRNSPPH